MGRESLPWYSYPQLLLHGYEEGEYPQRCRGRGEHDDEPEIQLRFRPVIFAPALDDEDFGHGCCCCGVGGEDGMRRSGGKVRARIYRFGRL